jgi:cysteinyl-tRNA synthetase
MKIYNTLSRSKEEFIPLVAGEAKIYACGPTVYNYFHVGNARPFIVFDCLRRYLEFLGYKVTFVQNFTDVDDKMIAGAAARGISVDALAERFIAEYFADARELGVREADFHPRATENIGAILALVQALVDKGFAYEAGGDVYFETRKFAEYGKLSKTPLDDLEAGARIQINETKKNPADFALWKKQKPGEPAWESPWGMGRPGWHIECSAMARAFLGDSVDIHAGGQDLIFPHHENEIAQSEACSGKIFAKYWMHNGYININNEKMSKSKGNFFTVRDVAKRFDYEAIRFFMLSAHYRSALNFSDELLEQSKAGLARMYNCYYKLDFARSKAKKGALDKAAREKSDAFEAQFLAAMDDDLNTADAIAAIFDLVRYANGLALEAQSLETLTYILEIFRKLCALLGIVQREQADTISDEAKALLAERGEARKEKNFARADEIRAQLAEMGIELEDTRQGVKVHVRTGA